MNEINTSGRNKIKNVDQGRVCTIMEECLGPMPSTFKPATDDSAFEKKKSLSVPKLYKFLDETPLAQGKDIQQDMLEEDNIYILIGLVTLPLLAPLRLWLKSIVVTMNRQ